MPTFITKRYNTTAGAGVDFTTAAQVSSYINALDPVALDQHVTILLESDIELSGSLVLLSSDDTRRVVLTAGSGMSPNDLHPNTLNYPATGVQLSLPRSAVNRSHGSGLDIKNLRVLITGVTGSSGVGYFYSTRRTGSTFDTVWTNNRIRDESLNAALSLDLGNGNSKIQLTDNFIEITGVASKQFARSNNIAVKQNTVVATGAAAGTGVFLTADFSGTTINNSVFIGMGSLATTNVAITKCFSNTTPTGQTTGVTVNTAAGALVVSEASDLRPTAGGPLIGAATAEANNTLDIRGANRGAAPDVGAYQLVVVVPPTGTIATQPQPDGQSQRFTGTTTAATSGTYTLTGTNGGQTVGPLSFAVTANAFDFTHTALLPGDYTPTLTVTGSGGAAGVSGTSAFSIIGVGGGGEIANDPGDTTQPVMAGAITVSQIKESSFAASWSAASDNIAVEGYEYSLGGAYLPLGLVTSYTFTAQPVGTPVSLSIRAFDGAGLRSNILTAAPFSTLVAQVPAAPTGVVATLGTAGQVSVAFTPDPVVIDNPTTLYTVSASNGQTATGTASPVLITMPLGFNGSFTVSATNVIGTSAESAASNVIVIASPDNPDGDAQDPVMVGGISIDLLTHDTIGVSWQAATDNVGITNYQFTFDGVTWENNGTARSIIRNGLKSETSYPFSVRARDDAGNTSDPLAVLITTLEAPAPVLPAYVPSSPASSRSYTWLKDAIVRWSHRDNLADMLDDFIMLAEKRINGDLEARLQVAATTIRTTPNLDGALMPADIAEIKALAVPGHAPMEYLAPDAFNAHYLRQESGTPKFYTVFGPYLHMIPTPDARYDIACAYRQKIPSLLDEADGVNWLIQEQPNIYLAACMLEVIDFTKNFAEQDTWARKYAMAVDAVNGSDWDMPSSLRIRTDTRTV